MATITQVHELYRGPSEAEDNNPVDALELVKPTILNTAEPPDDLDDFCFFCRGTYNPETGGLPQFDKGVRGETPMEDDGPSAGEAAEGEAAGTAAPKAPAKRATAAQKLAEMESRLATLHTKVIELQAQDEAKGEAIRLLTTRVEECEALLRV